MATVRQNKTTVSIERDSLTQVAMDNYLSNRDVRIFVYLLSTLDGTVYKKLDIEQMSDVLQLKKRTIMESLELLDYRGYIMRGGDIHVKCGWKFII